MRKFLFLMVVTLSSCLVNALEPATDIHSQAVARSSYAGLPLTFEANEGQVSDRAAFIARGSGYNLFLSQQRITLVLASGKSGKTDENVVHDAIIVDLLNGDKQCTPRGSDEMPGKVNYMFGKDERAY